MTWAYVIAVAWITSCVLRLGGWRWLNAVCALLGRAIAWFMLGGLGWKLARVQIERERAGQRLAELQARLAAERWRSSGFPAGERVRMLAAGGRAYPSFGDQLDRFEPRAGWTTHPPCRSCTCACAWCTRSPGQRVIWR